MKKLMLASFLLIATAANAAGPIDLTVGGSRLGKEHKGVFKNILGHVPFTHAGEGAVRLYVTHIAGKQDSYHGILINYAPPSQVGVPYLGAHVLNQLPNKIFGYLNHILEKISVYEMTISAADPTIYAMKPVKVEGDKILVDEKATPMTLKLSDQVRIDDPIGGAKIYQVNEKGEQKERYSFPTGGGRWLTEYRWIRNIYNLAHLASSWHKEYMTGPYLAAYEKQDDVVLHLAGEGESMSASFVSDPKFDRVNKKKREGIFTNPKSAALRGEFKATQAIEGMYVLTPKGEAQDAGKDATGRIGLFIDIFDAREALDQAVVELVFVNPADPKDFLMYYTGKAKGLEERASE